MNIPLSVRYDKKFCLYMRMHNSHLSEYEKINTHPSLWLYLLDPYTSNSFIRIENLGRQLKNTSANMTSYYYDFGIFLLRTCDALLNEDTACESVQLLNVQRLSNSWIFSALHAIILPWLNDIFTPEDNERRWHFMSKASVFTHPLTRHFFDIHTDIFRMTETPDVTSWSMQSTTEYTLLA